jgi:hypothetical protein
MIVMAIGTTAMAGPLLKLFYPDRLMRRDLAEADRVRSGGVAAHRVLVLVDRPDADGALVDLGAALAASREHSELILSHLVAHTGGRLEVGAGLGGELVQMTGTMNELQALAHRAEGRGVPAIVQSRFSEDVRGELPTFVAAAEPDTVILRPDGAVPGQLAADGTIQLVTVLRTPPADPSAVAVRWARGADGAAAVQVAAQLAVANQLGLVLTPDGGRPTAVAADLARRGLTACAGRPPPGALLVAAAGDSADAHLAVAAGIKEGSDDLDQWVRTLEGSRAP